MHFPKEEEGKLLHVYKRKSSPGSLGQLAFTESQSHTALPAADSNKSVTVCKCCWGMGMWDVVSPKHFASVSSSSSGSFSASAQGMQSFHGMQSFTK